MTQERAGEGDLIRLRSLVCDLASRPPAEKPHSLRPEAVAHLTLLSFGQASFLGPNPAPEDPCPLLRTGISFGNPLSLTFPLAV